MPPLSLSDRIGSLAAQIWFWLLSIVMNLAWLPALLMPRVAVRKGLEWWSALALWGYRLFVGLDYEIRGRENLPATPCLIAMKHFAMWETLLLPVLLKDPAAVLKKELKSVPFYGWYASKMRMIFVDREAHVSALKAMVAQARAELADGRSVVIFPEGTRVAPGLAPDYKPGVAALYNALNVPCVPVALNSGLYWKGIWRRRGRIVIEFLPPIAPGLKRQAFMTALEGSIETATARLLAEAGFKA